MDCGLERPFKEEVQRMCNATIMLEETANAEVILSIGN